MAPASFYRTIEHTADIGIEVEAPDITGIFVRSALAMFDLMLGLESVERKISRKIQVEAEATDELLVAWLNELLYVYAVERMIFSDFTDLRIRRHSLSALGWGEDFDPKKHSAHMEIKAATYHGISVCRSDDRWRGRVIFDV